MGKILKDFEKIGGKPRKATIAGLLAFQAKNTLDQAIIARKEFDLDLEIKNCINTQLLLGITMEGVANEVGEPFFEAGAWKIIERGTTPEKWEAIWETKRKIDRSIDPFQIVKELKKIRDEIVHPKAFEDQQDMVVVSKEGEFLIEPKDEDILPETDFTIYLGYLSKYQKFNSFATVKLFKRALKAILEISKLNLPIYNLNWADVILFDLEKIELGKNKIEKFYLKTPKKRVEN